jgi:hypothetical protein
MQDKFRRGRARGISGAPQFLAPQFSGHSCISQPVSVPVPVGSDSDGVPVWWEEVNGTTPSEPSLVVPEGSPAVGGRTLLEWLVPPSESAWWMVSVVGTVP